MRFLSSGIMDSSCSGKEAGMSWISSLLLLSFLDLVGMYITVIKRRAPVKNILKSHLDGRFVVS